MNRKWWKLIYMLPITFCTLYAGGYVAQFIRNYQTWESAGNFAGNGTAPQIPSPHPLACLDALTAFPYNLYGIFLCLAAFGLLTFLLMRMGFDRNGEITDRGRNLNYSTTATFISNRSGDVTVGVSSEAKQLNSWRVSDYTPEYRQTRSIGKRKLLTPDEILRLPLDTALIILRGQKVLQVEKYDYTLHPDAQKLIPRKASEHIPEWRKGACSEEYTYTPTIPASHPKKTASYGKQKKKKAEPHFDQQSVYQEPGYHDFPDDFSADNYSDHTDMVPLDKDSIMS